MPYYWIQQAIDNAGLGGTRVGKPDSPIRLSLIKKYGAQGWQSRLATPILLSASKNKVDKPAEYWDVNEAVNLLDAETAWAIGEAFGAKFGPDTENAALLLKNSWGAVHSLLKPKIYSDWYLKLYGDRALSSKGMSLIDNLALDYFVDTKYVFVKTHPNDPISEGNIARWYGNGARPAPNMPYQILSRLYELKGVRFDTVLGYASTSLQSLNPALYNKTVILGSEFFFLWMQLHDIYTALRFALDRLSGDDIYCPKYMQNDDIYCPKYMQNVVDLLLKRLGTEKRSKVMAHTDETKKLRNAFVFFSETFYHPRCFNGLHGSVTLCFLNCCESFYFYDEKLNDSFYPLEVIKTPLRKTYEPCRDSSLWLYNITRNFCEEIEDFSCLRELPRTGAAVSARPMPPSKRYECLKSMTAEFRAAAYESAKREFEALYNACVNVDDVFFALLRNEKNYLRYLTLLGKRKVDLLLICAVKDTLGNAITADVLAKLNELGFTKPSKKLWTTYIGVLDHGNCLCDLAPETEQPSNYENETLKLKVTSQSWRKGNTAEIIIDEVDYAVNARGLNIVVWDTKESRLVDSAAFDAHARSDAVCYRREPHFLD
ncbi:MAG: hypothetical protein LBB94_00355 [Clostridiales bacterium]|jgi:hypothetical protein|nr:hypothetical protein [Clostridiales bacterium]